MKSMRQRGSIGLALGGGSARGWAHIGVIRALEEAGVRPDYVAGTSMGALVGAAYAAGEIDRLEAWARAMRVRDIVGFFDLGVGSGLLKGERLIAAMRREFAERRIEDLPKPFAATATALNTGHEVWLRTGPALDAVRASIALPGLFTPVPYEGMLLVDGGLANPIPVSLVRAMGAELLIAVDLGSDLIGSRLRERHAHERSVGGESTDVHAVEQAPAATASKPPSIVDVLVSSLQIMQVRIGRSRMAGEPPDVHITPHLSHFRPLDYHCAAEAIDEGRRAVERVMHQIDALGLTSEQVRRQDQPPHQRQQQ